MCFWISNRYPKVLIAKRNIICYKNLRHIRWENNSLSIYSEYTHLFFYGFNYKLNKIYKEKKFDKEHYYLTSRNYGFHSYTNYEKAKKVIYKGDNLYTYKCIIPKGSKYYVSPEDNERLSNQIIIKEIIKNKK